MGFKQFLLESDSKRQSLQKIQQMSGKRFVEFIEKLRPFIKKGKFDFSILNVSEKVDGQAFRVGVLDGKVFVESSHSGVVTNPSDFTGPYMTPFKEVLLNLQKRKKDLLSIYEKHGSFKVMGELLYTKDSGIDDDGTITIVATKYKASLLGDVATMVMFNEMVYVDEQFTNSDSSVVRDAMKKSSTKDIQFVDTNKIKWQGEGSLLYNLGEDELESILLNPKELLSDRARLKLIQQQFVDAFESVVKSRGSVFGIDSSVVEGIVLDVPNFGMVGASNTDWTKLKKVIFEQMTKVDDLKKKFFKDVAGYVVKRKIEDTINKDSSGVTTKIQKLGKVFRKELQKVKKDYEKGKHKLPKNIVKTQEEGLYRNIDKLSSIKDSNDLILFLNHKL